MNIKTLVRGALYMGIAIMLITQVYTIFIPLAEGKRILLHEPNRLIAITEIATFIALAAFLVSEYFRIMREG